VPKRQLSLTNFRLKIKDSESKEDHQKRNTDLVTHLCSDGRLFVVAGLVDGQYFVRISVPSNGDEKDYQFFFDRLIEVCNVNNLF